MNKKVPPKKIDSTKAFENAIKRKDNRKFVLRLFITGMTPKSIEAINAVQGLCEEHLKGRYELEIIDLYKDPSAAKKDQVFAAPTLIKLLPLPIRKMVGDMSKEDKILAGLEVEILK